MNISAAKTYIELLGLSRSMANGKKMYEFQKRCLDGIYICLRGDYIQDPETGKMMGSRPSEKVDKSAESGIIMIGKSLSAKAKNYPVKLPDSRQHTKFSEGQIIVGKAFAGKTTDKEIRDRFRLESTYHIPADEWMKVSGKGKVIVNGQEVFAELHWYEANGERHEIKIKRYIDESKVHKSE